MTEREKAICEVFTGVCFCAGERREAVYQYASELLGRPIFTHEFYTLQDTLKELARPDFVAVCQDKYRTCETCAHEDSWFRLDPCASCANCYDRKVLWEPKPAKAEATP
jgi:hypothetical protein